MTTVPGTYFTKEQLEAARKVDNVSVGDRTGSNELCQFGFAYYFDKKQYDKALAWYILAAMENNSYAQNNIGVLYNYGHGVPKNDMCAMKWFLKSAQGNDGGNAPANIGELFENGYGVPLDKYKALEWYCHGEDKTHRDRLKSEGYHLSASDKKKSPQQLRKETEAILEAEKKKLEAKQNKTEEEREVLVDVNITYNLVDGGKDAWKDVPVLLATSKQRYTEPMNNSATNKDQEIIELMKQIQLLKQERNTFESQAKQLQSLKQEESNLQRQIKERDRQLTLLRNDFQLLHDKNVTFQQQINSNDSKIASLQRENQELKLKTNSLEQQGREKDDKINILENEQHGHRRMSIQQTQTLNLLKQEKQTMEQDKTNTTNEMERLKSSYAILEQLLKSKEDVIMSLNRENQGNQQGANEMVDTLKSLLQSKNNEIELNNLKMENALDKEKGKIKKLLKEIKRLKQQQQQQTFSSRETRPSSSATVPESTTSNTGTNEDDPNNDFNYDTESSTENSSSDGTSSEDGDHANDLNYDSDV